MFNCKILADSVSPHGERLTTFEITYPYIIHAEIMTHRMFSRNTQSSRATPVLKNVERVQNDPFVPLTFRKNQKGMTDGDAMAAEELASAEQIWRLAIERAIGHAEGMAELGIHKALANRVLGPYQWFTMILTATDFDNYFALRCHPEAQAEIRTIAEMMKEQYDANEPHLLRTGEWHLPLVRGDERAMQRSGSEFWVPISIGRCARVSYLTHDGRRDPEGDIALHDRLLTNGHMSPFEHVARPFTPQEWQLIYRLQQTLGFYQKDQLGRYLTHQIEYAGNLHGWWSARMDVPNQHNYALQAVKSDGIADLVHHSASR